MGKLSRDKGKAFERWVASRFREALKLLEEIKRGWQARRGADAPDVVGVPGLWVEAKHGRLVNLRAALRQAEAAAEAAKSSDTPLVVAKDDRCDPVALLRFSAFLSMFAELYELRASLNQVARQAVKIRLPSTAEAGAASARLVELEAASDNVNSLDPTRCTIRELLTAIDVEYKNRRLALPLPIHAAVCNHLAKLAPPTLTNQLFQARLGVHCDHRGRGLYWCEECTPTLNQMAGWLGEVTARANAVQDLGNAARGVAKELELAVEADSWVNTTQVAELAGTLRAALKPPVPGDDVFDAANLGRDLVAVLGHLLEGTEGPVEGLKRLVQERADVARVVAAFSEQPGEPVIITLQRIVETFRAPARDHQAAVNTLRKSSVVDGSDSLNTAAEKVVTVLREQEVEGMRCTHALDRFGQLKVGEQLHEAFERLLNMLLEGADRDGQLRAELWAHLVSSHAVVISPLTSLADLHDLHNHEHEGPGTIRNHDLKDRGFSIRKIGLVLSEDDGVPEDALPRAGFSFDNVARQWVRENGPGRRASIAHVEGSWRWSISARRAIGGAAIIASGAETSPAEAISAVDLLRQGDEGKAP